MWVGSSRAREATASISYGRSSGPGERGNVNRASLEGTAGSLRSLNAVEVLIPSWRWRKCTEPWCTWYKIAVLSRSTKIPRTMENPGQQ